MAGAAVDTRLKAIASGDMTTAWNASAAAAGSLMLLGRARDALESIPGAATAAVITPREVRLVRAPSLHAYQHAIVTSACEGGVTLVRATAVLVPTRAAALQLQRTIEHVCLSSPPAAVVLPDILTRGEWYERLRIVGRTAREGGCRPFDREVMLQAAAHEAITEGAVPPFHLRPALVGEMLELYDELRRRQRQVQDFERLLVRRARAARRRAIAVRNACCARRAFSSRLTVPTSGGCARPTRSTSMGFVSGCSRAGYPRDTSASSSPSAIGSSKPAGSGPPTWICCCGSMASSASPSWPPRRSLRPGSTRASTICCRASRSCRLQTAPAVLRGSYARRPRRQHRPALHQPRSRGGDRGRRAAHQGAAPRVAARRTAARTHCGRIRAAAAVSLCGARRVRRGTRAVSV